MSTRKNCICSFEGLNVYDDTLEYKGRIATFTEIKSVRGGQSTYTLNFVTTSKISCLSIILMDGTDWTFIEKRAFFNNKRHVNICDITSIIKTTTLQARVTRLINDLQTNGQVLLHHSPHGRETIYLNKDGWIGNEHRGINLKEAETLGFGKRKESWGGHSKSLNPDIIVVSSRSAKTDRGIPKGAMQFVPNQYDVDVVKDFIWWLSLEGNHLP